MMGISRSSDHGDLSRLAVDYQITRDHGDPASVHCTKEPLGQHL